MKTEECQGMSGHLLLTHLKSNLRGACALKKDHLFLRDCHTVLGFFALFLFFFLLVMAHECFHIMHQHLLQSSTGRNKAGNSTSTHPPWEWLFPKNYGEGIISQPRKTNELQFV